MSDQELDPYFFNKSKLEMSGVFKFDEGSFSEDQIIEALEPLLTDERKVRIHKVLNERTFDFIPVMERIYDRGNVSAVMRSAESFGFLRCHLIESENAKFKAANRVTKGADKWMDVQVYRTPEESVRALKSSGVKIYSTHLSQKSEDLRDIDFSQPSAIVFGNEKDGVSEEMLSLSDGNVLIPMVGFSQSFNISVAAALTCFHVFMNRKSQLGKSGNLSSEQNQSVRANYMLRCFDRPGAVLKKIIG